MGTKNGRCIFTELTGANIQTILPLLRINEDYAQKWGGDMSNGKTPHLVQYQGSKRLLASEIVRYFPEHVDRLIEPFCGTCAVTIYAALKANCDSYWINDINSPLIMMMQECIEEPDRLADNYTSVWNGQFAEGENNIDYFYKIRDRFNAGEKTPEYMLLSLIHI